MINIIIGMFYIVLIALSSYLLYYIIKNAIKDAYYEIEFKNPEDEKDYKKTTFNSTEE